MGDGEDAVMQFIMEGGDPNNEGALQDCLGGVCYENEGDDCDEDLQDYLDEEKESEEDYKSRIYYENLEKKYELIP